MMRMTLQAALVGLTALVWSVGLPTDSVAQGTPQGQSQKSETARGELVSVDTTAHTLTIKPMQGAEQRFQYNEDTTVTGAEGGIAGLATKSGQQVTVQYTMQGADRLATAVVIGQPSR